MYQTITVLVLWILSSFSFAVSNTGKKGWHFGGDWWWKLLVSNLQGCWFCSNTSSRVRGSLVSEWILTSCQLHNITSGRSKAVTSKCTLQISFHRQHHTSRIARVQLKQKKCRWWWRERWKSVQINFLPPTGVFFGDVCKIKNGIREIMEWAWGEIRLD